MASERIDCLAVRELTLGDVSGAATARPTTVKMDGLMGISGGKIVFVAGGIWHTVTSS